MLALLVHQEPSMSQASESLPPIGYTTPTDLASHRSPTAVRLLSGETLDLLTVTAGRRSSRSTFDFDSRRTAFINDWSLLLRRQRGRSVVTTGLADC